MPRGPTALSIDDEVAPLMVELLGESLVEAAHEVAYALFRKRRVDASGGVARDLFELVFREHRPKRRKIGVPVVGYRCCIRKPAHGATSCRQKGADWVFFDDDGTLDVFELPVEENMLRHEVIGLHVVFWHTRPIQSTNF